MGSTYLSLYYHIVFATKNRAPLIRPDHRPALYGYISGTVLGLGGRCEIAGGMDDHLHALVRLQATHVVADFVRELKKASTAWMRNNTSEESFAWQEGYAAFTVSVSLVDEVRAYIENQAAHHRRRDYLEELRILLVRSGIEFDEKYLV